MTKDAKEELDLEFSGETQARMEYVSKSDKVFDVATKRTAPGSKSADSPEASEIKMDQDAIPTEMKIHVRTNGEEDDNEDPVDIITRPGSGLSHSDGIYSSEKSSRKQTPRARYNEVKEEDENDEEEFPEAGKADTKDE
jgi:hypothetical protein